MIKFCLIFQLYSSPRQCTETMKMKLSSFGNIFTPLLKELNPPPESLHISVRNTVFQDIWLLLPRFSHSSIHVYLCHIRIESSWFQQQATCKLQLVKYLQYDAANSMKTSFQYLTKKTCLKSSSGLLQRRSVSVKTQTWQAVLHIIQLRLYLGHYPYSFFYLKMQVYSKHSECDSWGLIHKTARSFSNCIAFLSVHFQEDFGDGKT